MFIGGCHCLYDAYWLFKEREQQKEINQMLVEMGVFTKGRSQKERERICNELQDILDQSNKKDENAALQAQEALVEFVKKYGKH